MDTLIMSNRTFAFFCGLPGSGKSTYCNTVYNNYHSFYRQYNGRIPGQVIEDTNFIVSADEFKEQNSDHELSVEWAKRAVLFLAKNSTGNILLDGGGINRHYNKEIISAVKELDLITRCIYFDTPIEVCLGRIAHRERKVPIEDIYKKNQLINSCVRYYQQNCDQFERINYFTNQYAFVDMDGTLCAYTKAKRDIDGNVDFVNGHMFRYLMPVKHVMDFMKHHYERANENFYILTAVPNSIVWQDKLEWIYEQMPWVKKDHILFVGNKDYKDVFLKCFLLKKGINPKDVLMVDDYHPTLDKMIKLGVNALHPSDINGLDSELSIFG